MSAHAGYVVAAYAMTALVLGGMIVGLLMDSAARRRELEKLEAGGVRRRSDRRESKA